MPDRKARWLRLMISAAASLAAGPLAAEVRESSDTGFVIQLGLDVPVEPAKVWAALLSPAKWWSGEHTFSRDAANLSIDPRAGGCFCEVLPNEDSPNAAPRGSVEHMRVIYIERPRALRMTGALGPLQAGAAAGTLTVILKPNAAGTRILWEYDYGGYIRGDVRIMAESTDRMLADQLLRLGARLGAGAKSAPRKGDPQSKSQPASRGDDFAREMQGILQADHTGKPADERAGDASEDPPRDPGFIGR